MRKPPEKELEDILARYPHMKKKERLALQRQTMPEQEPEARRRNMREVPMGYTEIAARLEALRCLECKNKPCVEGCPVHIDIPAFLALIRDGDFRAAIAKVREANCVPAVTGRVCPQELQCQLQCTVAKALKNMDEAVSIGSLERFLADWEREHALMEVPDPPSRTGKKVAVVGSGPAGLAVAGDLIKLGHDVTIFEAFHKMGGVLVYGIPEFRLPKEIVHTEIAYLKGLGVEFVPNTVIGQTITIDELLSEEGYDAVFIGSGAGLPSFMNIPGEELIGVCSANEYLTRVNLMEAYRFPQSDTPPIYSRNAAVFGGGNVAMDAARTAIRLGAENVYLIYRRSEQELPARKEEARHAREEGVRFLLLTNPVAILPDSEGRVRAVRLIRMELGEPDESGRRRPIPIPGSEVELEVDTVIEAIGTLPNPLIPATTSGLETSLKGTIAIDEQTCKTSKKGVFAGGDIVSGAATVILAMGQGRRAARAIHHYVTTGEW